MQSIKIMGSSVAQLRWAIDASEELARETAGRFPGCQFATTLESALQDPECDAVIIASTTNTHFAFVKQSLTAGKPTFTEKPISHDPTEVAEIVSLAKTSRIPFIVGYQRRCDKNFRRMRDMIRSEGAIGDPRVIRCTSRDNPIPPMAYLRTSGGIFHDMLSHDFDMIHFLTGQIPESVYSVGHCYNEEIKAMDDIDTAVVTLTFASGLLATVDTSRIAAYGYDQRVEVFGSDGMATTHNEQETTVEVATTAGYLKPVAEWSFPQRYKHTYTVELAEFCAMLMQRPMLPEPDEYLDRHIDLEKVATAAELSLRLRRRVLIAEVDSLRHQLPNH